MKKYKSVNTAAFILPLLPCLMSMPASAAVEEYQYADTNAEETSAECTVIYKTTYEFSETIPKYPSTLEVSASGYDGIYDGNAHGILVNCGTDGASISYSYDGVSYFSEKPVYTDAGTYVTYYKVEKDGYASVAGCETVRIREAAINYSSSDYNGAYDGREHGIHVTVITDGCKIFYSEDGVNYSPEKPAYKEAGEYITYFKITKKNYTDAEGENRVVIEKADGSLGDISKVQTGDSSGLEGPLSLFVLSGIGLAAFVQKRLIERRKTENEDKKTYL